MREARALAAVALLLLAGCSLGPGAPDEGESLGLTEAWTAGGSAVEGNHHAIAAGRVGDGHVVAIPVGGYRGEGGCELFVVDGDGRERWTAAIPPEACTIHAVADPTVADFAGDGEPEVIAATTQEQVVAHDPRNGSVRFRFPLSDYGYTRPVVADVVGDGAPELVVTDVSGSLFVVRSDGSTAWNRSLDAYSWSEPAVADLDADGATEIAVGLGNGTAVAFAANGDLAWRTGVAGPITWTAHGDVDSDDAREFVVATDDGVVAALDGRDGRVEWRRSLGSLAAVRGVADGDGAERSSAGSATQPHDGDVEVYATANDATLRALSGESGETEWTTSLTDASTQMTPPPVVGDVTGDGDPEVVAVTNDGYVRVVDPADGRVLASYHRDAAVYTHATLANVTAAGGKEVLVMYGDGTAVALSVQSSA